MLIWFTVLVMLIVGYSMLQEGLFNAFCVTANILLAGLLTFNFFEPLADIFDGWFLGTFLEGYEDGLVLMTLFASFLGLFRLGMNLLVPSQIQFPSLIQQIGAAVIGLFAGYLLAGFLICVFQTLPAHEQFLGFDLKVASEANAGGVRSYMPPDRVWLAIMNRAGLVAFQRTSPTNTFDPLGSFEYRYARFRRFTETRKPLTNSGELGP